MDDVVGLLGCAFLCDALLFTQPLGTQLLLSEALFGGHPGAQLELGDQRAVAGTGLFGVVGASNSPQLCHLSLVESLLLFADPLMRPFCLL